MHLLRWVGCCQGITNLTLISQKDDKESVFVCKTISDSYLYTTGVKPKHMMLDVSEDKREESLETIFETLKTDRTDALLGGGHYLLDTVFFLSYEKHGLELS